eukprot:gene2283-2498_t
MEDDHSKGVVESATSSLNPDTCSNEISAHIHSFRREAEVMHDQINALEGHLSELTKVFAKDIRAYLASAIEEFEHNAAEAKQKFEQLRSTIAHFHLLMTVVNEFRDHTNSLC